VGGNIYVADEGNNRIQKFTSDGQFLTKWGEFGTGDGEFISPSGIAIDDSNYVYVVDSHHGVQKFTPDGKFVAEFEDGLYDAGRKAIDVDSESNLYVSAASGHIAKKLSSDGQVIAQWGGYGTEPGLMRSPVGIAVTQDGENVYVVEDGSSRLQAFTRTLHDPDSGDPTGEPVVRSDKAILLAAAAHTPAITSGMLHR